MSTLLGKTRQKAVPTSFRFFQYLFNLAEHLVRVFFGLVFQLCSHTRWASDKPNFVTGRRATCYPTVLQRGPEEPRWTQGTLLQFLLSAFNSTVEQLWSSPLSVDLYGFLENCLNGSVSMFFNRCSSYSRLAAKRAKTNLFMPPW